MNRIPYAFSSYISNRILLPSMRVHQQPTHMELIVDGVCCHGNMGFECSNGLKLVNWILMVFKYNRMFIDCSILLFHHMNHLFCVSYTYMYCITMINECQIKCSSVNCGIYCIDAKSLQTCLIWSHLSNQCFVVWLHNKWRCKFNERIHAKLNELRYSI